MKLRNGDNVIVITGADKGKIGKILRIIRESNRVLVEGVNFKKKHQKSRRQGQKGQIIDKPLSIHASNVMLLDPKKNVRTRVGISRESGTATRIARKSGAVIEK